MNITLKQLDHIVTQARERDWDESSLGSPDVPPGEQPITWLSEKLEQYRREPNE